MSNGDDIDVLAGEYVLGTLDSAERVAVAARRGREPALDGAIRDWERRLAPLDTVTSSIPPPDGLLDAIERRLTASPSTLVDSIDWRRRATIWKRTAMAASVAAASLLAVVGVRENAFRTQQQQTFIGVFAEGDILPKFYLTIDLATRSLTVRPIDAQRQPGKTYQLWIASEQLGTAPRSLGLVEETLAPTTKALTDYDPALLQRATFGVSIEPTGGSPTGRPSPGALHAKLLPVAR